MDFFHSVRDLPLKYQIAAVLTCVLLIFFAIALPLLIKPNATFDEVTEDCGPEMSMKSRRVLLYWHNWYRSKTAKGEYKIANKDSKLKVLPPATRMPQLTYNCSLEKSSLKWAHIAQCKMVHSKTKGIGENLYAAGTRMPLEEASNQATWPWAEELSKFGMLDLTDWRGGQKGHASQMLWDKTQSVGCGTIRCANKNKMVVCHYYPMGNFVNKPIYKAGDMLSDCGKEGRKEVPFKKTGLCILL
ncbi:hypothetical protein Y032_0695g1604 [Ancylostoma ceylanicum]|nr:hypothetical protein Y032_0695g1604 [Ancylostoma ceylanicum]